MHIPDHFVSDPINGLAAAVSLAAVAYSFTRLRKNFHDNKHFASLLGAFAAFVFAAQMLNFPIGGATSGHFLGAAAVAALLGPWSACVVMAFVLTVQAFLFGDGGVSALGTNILNMGVVGGLAVYPLTRRIRALLPQGRAGYFAAVAAGSWTSVVIASALCAAELSLSGTSPLAVALPAMLEAHALIGVGEAAITLAVVGAVASAHPSFLPSWAETKTPAPLSFAFKAKSLAAGGLVVALTLASFASPFASSSPDGLEKVAETIGFLQVAEEGEILWSHSLFPDYAVSSIAQEGLSTGLAGLIGTLSVFGFVLASAAVIRRFPARNKDALA